MSKAYVDCHAHVFGPQAQFPYVEHRRYTPPDATLAEYKAMLARNGIARAVLTQGSVHGTDNSAMIAALNQAGPDFRAIVMIEESVTDRELEAFHAAGVRGLRTQLKAEGGKPLDAPVCRRLAERVRPFGWHVEIHVDVAVTQDVEDLLGGFPVPVVVEHMGRLPPEAGVGCAGFQSLLRFLKNDGGWVKVSGAYLTSRSGPPNFTDMRPVAEAVLEAAPDRAVWGSNWPHPRQSHPPDEGLLLRLLFDWAGQELAERVLADNPARLYDFPEARAAQ